MSQIKTETGRGRLLLDRGEMVSSRLGFVNAIFNLKSTMRCPL